MTVALDLDAIRLRALEVSRLPLGNLTEHLLDGRISSYTSGGQQAAAASVIARDRSADDVPALLAEVTRLRPLENVGVGARNVEGIRELAAELDKEIASAMSPQQAIGMAAARDALRWVLGQDPR